MLCDDFRNFAGSVVSRSGQPLYTLGGFIHILLVLAIVVLLITSDYRPTAVV